MSDNEQKSRKTSPVGRGIAIGAAIGAGQHRKNATPDND